LHPGGLKTGGRWALSQAITHWHPDLIRDSARGRGLGLMGLQGRHYQEL